jgi:hypothetical protein
MEGKECCDAMLWIGQSYYKIDCGQKLGLISDCCEIIGKKKRCYVHEAEMRGCCRKIPRTPKWLIQNKSRIFLIHRDGKSKDKGSIFGYFVLRRFEHIISRGVNEAITNYNKIPWPEEVCQNIISTILEKVEAKKIGDILGVHQSLIESNVKDEFLKYWKKGVEQQLSRGYCLTPKPKVSVTFQWPSPDETVKESMIDILEDILEELIENWIEEQINKLNNRPPERYIQWRRAIVGDITGNSEHVYISIEDTWCEESRYCSKRLKEGATYIVDALTATITDAFAQKLAEKHPITLREGEELFHETVKEIRLNYRNGTLTKIAPPYKQLLKGHTNTRGELVVFKEPYPIFERKPKAAFRGLLYVDGDKLLSEIVKHYEAVKDNKKNVRVIPYEEIRCGLRDK